jgi:hypothetical protein
VFEVKAKLPGLIMLGAARNTLVNRKTLILLIIIVMAYKLSYSFLARIAMT